MVRLDQALADHGYFPSREQAKRAILAGRVRVNGQVARHASERVRLGDELTVTEAEKYVSRGGWKLEGALRDFGLAVTDLTALDVGASTGGFTDCLLQHGAARVYALDVGRGQLAWRLRSDARVVVMERVNARFLAPELFPAGFDGAALAVVDCSFISLRLILPAVDRVVRRGGRILALIKPQFEAGRRVVAQGRGVVRSEAVRAEVIDGLNAFVAARPEWRWLGVNPSTLLGPAGNQEYFVLIEKVA